MRKIDLSFISNYIIVNSNFWRYYFTENNIRENRRGNHEWTIQRHWQHWAQKTKINKTKTITHVLDTTMRKQTQIRRYP